MATEWTWTKTATGAVRMVCGVKDEQPVAVEATVLEVELARVKVALQFFVGSAVAWEDRCDLVSATGRARVVRLLEEKRGITLRDEALLALLQACRARGRPRSDDEPAIGTATAEPRVVPLGELLTEIMAYIDRHMVIAKEAVVATALWIVHTYAIDAAEVTPYLNINSPDKRCGKSRFLELLQGLVARPWYVLRPTEAVLFRQIAKVHPTLLIDEVDTIFKDKSPGSEGLRGLLDAGNRRGVKVPRCMGDKHDVVEFDTFCPRALAGIGKAVPDTVVDRSINIRLVRKKKTEKRERLRVRKLAAETAPIRAGLETWALAETIARLREAEPALPEALDDRAADGLEPLLAIADEAGGEWPALARWAAITLYRAGSDGESDRVQLLRAIYEVFEERKVDRIFTRELLAVLVARESEPWGGWWGKDVAVAKDGETPRGPAVKLAALLRPFDVRPKDIRIADETGKGYDCADFADAFERYVAQASDAEKGAEEPETSAPGASPPSGDATTRQPASDADSRAREVATRQPGVATPNGAEPLAGEDLPRCRDLDGGESAAAQPEGFEEGFV